MYQIKSIAAQVKDVDISKRTVSGYFSVFDVKDADKDIIRPGAFAGSITTDGPDGKNRILHLWQHDPTQPLAKPRELKEDQRGLFFRSVITETTYGRDVLKLYQDEVISEHSIGFNTVKSHWSDVEGANIITEIKLWEGSSVTWASQQLATGDLDGKEEYLAKLNKAYYRGNYTDETFHLLDAQRKRLKSMIEGDRVDKIRDTFSRINRKLKHAKL